MTPLDMLDPHEQEKFRPQAALISAFGLLVGLIFGEQSALKRPNVDH